MYWCLILVTVVVLRAVPLVVGAAGTASLLPATTGGRGGWVALTVHKKTGFLNCSTGRAEYFEVLVVLLCVSRRRQYALLPCPPACDSTPTTSRTATRSSSSSSGGGSSSLGTVLLCTVVRPACVLLRNTVVLTASWRDKKSKSRVQRKLVFFLPNLVLLLEELESSLLYLPDEHYSYLNCVDGYGRIRTVIRCSSLELILPVKFSNLRQLHSQQ